jgi:hypothetical protein
VNWCADSCILPENSYTCSFAYNDVIHAFRYVIRYYHTKLIDRSVVLCASRELLYARNIGLILQFQRVNFIASLQNMFTECRYILSPLMLIYLRYKSCKCAHYTSCKYPTGKNPHSVKFVFIHLSCLVARTGPSKSPLTSSSIPSRIRIFCTKTEGRQAIPAITWQGTNTQAGLHLLQRSDFRRLQKCHLQKLNQTLRKQVKPWQALISEHRKFI